MISPRLPRALSRQQQFELALAAAYHRLLVMTDVDQNQISIRYSMIPTNVETRQSELAALGVQGTQTPFATVTDDGHGRTVIVMHRKPIEVRREKSETLSEIVYTVLLGELSQVLGRRPEELDPNW